MRGLILLLVATPVVAQVSLCNYAQCGPSANNPPKNYGTCATGLTCVVQSIYYGQCKETPNPSAAPGCSKADGYCTATKPCCSASAVCSANKCTIPCGATLSATPTVKPTAKPTASPTITAAPTAPAKPTAKPTASPTITAAPSTAPATLVQVVQSVVAPIISVKCFDVHGVSVPGGASTDGFLTTQFDVNPSSISTCDITGPQAVGSSFNVFAGPTTASPLAWSRELSGLQYIYTVFQVPAPDTSAGAVCARTGGVSFTTTLASLTSLMETSTTVTFTGGTRQTTLQKDFENLFNSNHVRCTAYNFDANTWTGCTTLTDLQLSTRTTFRESNIAGALLRAVFHDAGEFKADAADLLGPDGCLSTLDGRNSGLMQITTLLMTDIEQIWQRYCDRISRADLWALFGKWAAERQEPTRGLREDAAGPLPSKPVMYIPYAYGRKDNARCNEGSYRLPQHQPGLPEYQRAMIDNMELTMADDIVLVGAHSIGHVHTENSGFGFLDTEAVRQDRPTENAWDESPNRFDNQYFLSLVIELWQNHQEKFQGLITKTFSDKTSNFWIVNVVSNPGEDIHPKTIMLNSDMVLGFKPDVDVGPDGFSNIGVIGQVCAIGNVPNAECNGGAPTTTTLLLNLPTGAPQQFTATYPAGCQFDYGCAAFLSAPATPGWTVDTFLDTNQPGSPAVNFGNSLYDKVENFIFDNNAFIRAFEDAYPKMVNTGYSVNGVATSSGQFTSRSNRLGDLTLASSTLVPPYSDFTPQYAGLAVADVVAVPAPRVPVDPPSPLARPGCRNAQCGLGVGECAPGFECLPVTAAPPCPADNLVCPGLLPGLGTPVPASGVCADGALPIVGCPVGGVSRCSEVPLSVYQLLPATTTCVLSSGATKPAGSPATRATGCQSDADCCNDNAVCSNAGPSGVCTVPCGAALPLVAVGMAIPAAEIPMKPVVDPYRDPYTNALTAFSVAPNQCIYAQCGPSASTNPPTNFGTCATGLTCVVQSIYYGQCKETPNPSAVAGCGSASNGYCSATIPCCSPSAVCSANKCSIPCGI